MVRNPKRRGAGASNSFTRAEVDAAFQLFETLARGGDVSIIARAPAVQSVRAKFARMRLSVVQGRSGADEPERRCGLCREPGHYRQTCPKATGGAA